MKNKYFKKTRKVLGVVLFILTIISANAQTVLTVTKTSDPNPFDFPYNYVDSLCDPVMFGTLQWAIRKANDSPDTSTIVFNISGSGQHIILLSYELPSFSKPVNIDGTTQQGYQFGHPVIIIDGGGQIATGIKYYMINGQVVKGLQIQNFWMQGIHFWGSIGAEISNNVINRISNGPSDYAAMGIRFDDVQNTNIKGNYIGTDFNKVSGIGCEDYGIHITQFTFSDGNNIIGGSGINDKNVIAFNGLSGIWIAQSLRNLITRNPIFNNSIGIHLVQSANNLKPSPIISTFTSNVLSGTSQPYDIIEIFGSTGDENANEYITSTTVNTSGNWSVNITATYPYFIASATDINNNTSTLSSAFPSGLPITPLTVSYTVTDATCNGANNGSISVVVSGGVPPYTYEWGAGQTTANITGLSAGIYDVIVSDSLNNTVVQAITVNEPPIDLLTSPPACSELFISEYVEGTGHKTALEFYNPSDDTLLLNRYFVRVFMNGAPTPLVTQLSGILLPGKTHVIANPNADAEILAIANQTSNKINFNGDDAIQFVKVLNNVNINLDSIEGHGGNPHDILDTLQLVILDQIGITNVTPGNGSWPVGNSGSTKNSTIIRNAGVSTSQPDWNCGQYQWQSMPQNDISNLGQHQSTCKLSVPPVISLRFQNPTQTTISGTKYFNFDVEVKASSDTASFYFNLSQFYIKYNTHAFGTNANVTMQLGPLLDSLTYNAYYTTIETNSLGNKVFRVNIKVINPNPSPSRTLLPSTYIKLAHFSIEIDTCNLSTGLSFDTTFVNSNQAHYDFLTYASSATEPPLSNTGYHYGGPLYKNDMNITLCDSNLMWISEFTSPIYPGTWFKGTTDNKSELTIEGIGFGSSKGNGNVYFMNANKGGQNFTPIDSKDFISWGDSLIKIRMPSLIDSIPFSNRIPGSGLFYIKTINDSIISSTPIDIPYSVINVSKYGQKWRANIANIINDSVGIVFYLGPSITDYIDTLVVSDIKKAVKEWSCQTQINMRVGGYTNTDYSSPNDGINVIHFVDLFPDSSTLALTSMQFTDCIENNGDTIVFAKDIDIAIKEIPIWGYWHTDTIGDLPSNSKDFYSVVLHELGHVNAIDHVNYEDLMFYNSQYDYFNPIIQANRRIISSNDAEGGKEVVNKSLTIQLTSNCNYYSATIYEFQCGSSKIDKNTIEVIGEFKLYPNPFSYNGINISYKLNQNTLLQYTIIDFTGKEVYRSSKINKQKGNYDEHINTGHFAPGIYLFIINYNGYSKAFKIINQ